MTEDDEFDEKTYKKFYGFTSIKTLLKDIPFLKKNKAYINDYILECSKLVRKVSIF